MSILYTIISFLAGAAGALQSIVNGQLKLHVDNSFLASFFSFLGGVITLGVLLLISFATKLSLLPTSEMLCNTKWWMWIGGPLGVICVMAAILLPPRIGFSAFFGTLIAGQLIAGVLMDHFGFLGSQVHPITWTRVLGVLCLVAGVLLIQKN